MIIRAEGESLLYTIILGVGLCVGVISSKFVESIPLSVALIFGSLFLFFILVRVMRFLQGRYWGDIVAIVTQENAKINGKTVKWETVTRWNMQTKAIQGFSFTSVIFNCLIGSYSRTFYVSTPNKTIIVNDAPKRLQKCFQKYVPNAYDSNFIIKEPKNKVT